MAPGLSRGTPPAIASVWLPNLATDLIERRKPASRDRPLVLYRETGGRLEVMAANELAAQAGIIRGMTLADARALEARLTTAAFEPARLQAALKAIARWFERYSPTVALDPPDGLFLDMSGGLHLFGDGARLLQRLLGDLDRLGFRARAALAPAGGAAHALARHAGEHWIVADPPVRDALAPLPIEALRLDPTTTARLKRLGLTRIENLYALSRQALVRRFGLTLANRMDQALGAAAEPLSPWREKPSPKARLAFETPIGEREQIDPALNLLIEKLVERLARQGLGAIALTLEAARVDGTRQSIQASAAGPTRDPSRIARLFRERLEGLDPGFGLQAMSLKAIRSEQIDIRQEDALGPRKPPDARAKLIDVLGGRLGFDAIACFAPNDDWRPEAAYRLAVPTRPAPFWPDTTNAAPRPLTLLKHPEPLTVATADVPLEPPAAIRRHGALRRVSCAAGPERITPPWAAPDPDWPAARDYWRVETEDGERLWLYREGERWRLAGRFP